MGSQWAFPYPVSRKCGRERSNIRRAVSGQLVPPGRWGPDAGRLVTAVMVAVQRAGVAGLLVAGPQPGAPCLGCSSGSFGVGIPPWHGRVARTVTGSYAPVGAAAALPCPPSQHMPLRAAKVTLR